MCGFVVPGMVLQDVSLFTFRTTEPRLEGLTYGRGIISAGLILMC